MRATVARVHTYICGPGFEGAPVRLRDAGQHVLAIGQLRLALDSRPSRTRIVGMAGVFLRVRERASFPGTAADI